MEEKNYKSEESNGHNVSIVDNVDYDNDNKMIDLLIDNMDQVEFEEISD